MVDSVKSIPTDPLGKPVVWSWVDEGGFRQTAVKAGVKHGHLRHGTKCARDDFNAFQLARLWSGANAAMRAIAVFSPAVMKVGSLYSLPPFTIRWPTMSTAEASRTTRA